MKRILLCVVFLLGISIQPAFAVKFSEAAIRLDRLKANTALSGLVCTTPSSPSAGTEAKVLITFPSDFSINASPLSWSTSTTTIPSDAIAWTGISTNASGVSGQTVTFTSSDLSAGVKYCFTFTANSSTTGATGAKTGTITTKTSGNSVINSTDYGLTITSSDQIGVRATVPASPTDFTATLMKTTAGTSFPQATKLTYQLTYNSSLPYASDITVQAEWSRGTVRGNSTPSIDVLTYVVGSGTDGYNNTAPVIDTVNRTISWTIHAFPGSGIDQTVSFQLETIDNDTSGSLVDFLVSGRVLGPGTQTTDSSENSSYQYAPPASSNSSSSESSPTATPTPTSSIQLLTIDNISMRTVASREASIVLTTSLPTSYSISYGITPAGLTRKITGLSVAKSHEITLTSLSPGTPYYFQITVTSNGNKKTSDIYTFTTSSEASIPLLPSLLITTNNFILLNEFLGTLYIPVDQHAAIQLKLPQIAQIKEIHILLYNDQQHSLDTSGNGLIESHDNTYQGELHIPSSRGIYDAYARVVDYSGNITETKIMTVRVLSPLIVRNVRTRQPIEHARITFLKKNLSQIFTLLPSTLGFQNPSYTTPDGTFDGVLLPGLYEVTVTAVGFKDKTITFDIATDGYPTVDLEPLPFNLWIGISLLLSVGALFFSSLQAFLQHLALSHQYFFFFTGFGFIVLAWIMLVSLAHRLHISLPMLPWYLFIGLPLTLFPHKKRLLIEGIVLDEKSKNPIPNAQITLIENASRRVLSHIRTRSDGTFSLIKPPVQEWNIRVMKKGYSEDLQHMSLLTNKKITIYLLPLKRKESIVKNIISVFTTELGHFMFEAFLLLSIGVSVLFGKTFGLRTVLPLAITTIICSLYWMLHLLHVKQHASVLSDN